MIKDIRELPDGTEIKADLIIIGGGLAGITLAREWAGKEKTVAIIESGGKEVEDDIQDLYSGTGRLSGADGAFEEIDSYLYESRARAYGGSGNWWGGVCVPLDPADFEERPWIKHSGWPMSRSDLQPFYNRACEALGIERFDETYAEHDSHLNLNDGKNVTTYPRQVCKITNQHQAEAIEYIYGFTEEPNISVYLYANVTSFALTPSKDNLDHLGIKTLNGKTYKAKGAAYVMACGGIENARLLLAANAQNDTKFGYRSDAVGRYFQGHTWAYKEPSNVNAGTNIHFSQKQDFTLYQPQKEPGKIHAFLGTTLDCQKASRSSAFHFRLYPYEDAGAPDELALRKTVSRIDNQDLNSDIGTHCVFSYEFENLPNPDSRITLSENKDALGMPRVDLQWQYGQDDYQCFSNSIDAIACEFGATAMGRVCFPIEKEEIIPLAGMSRHHMGSTRMNNDPALGVVDSNLKCHDADNLYIAGSSVFPTSGIANPTLTILALVMRLSDHLMTRLGA